MGAYTKHHLARDSPVLRWEEPAVPVRRAQGEEGNDSVSGTHDHAHTWKEAVVTV